MQANQSGWFKSSSSAQNGDCAEARRRADGGMDLRDSKDAGSPVLTFDRSDWAAFTTAVKDGSFESR
ncbi:DUF397 domain-containing protein [Streptomyces radicis]|uniref:DUF397 domain-containing protein n=1 Tax=Streptomyces radicis TaxID=1750517 RepID=A0A3A9VYY4_9ACTN|nr:DUF397 domain-containing protein [Streptomyces radicis]RKN05732.1 DUF397 domain-containing protein [Streptomyces radicis]RKN17530.1 DUF397 domain-containing protein [Streptomyces radicis]